MYLCIKQEKKLVTADDAENAPSILNVKGFRGRSRSVHNTNLTQTKPALQQFASFITVMCIYNVMHVFIDFK